MTGKGTRQEDGQMGSSTPEAGLAVGDPLANEARRRVRDRFHQHPDSPSLWDYVCTMARAAAEASANDDAGTLGGPLVLPHNLSTAAEGEAV